MFEAPFNVTGITAAHNTARWWHSVPGLCWDPCLAESARIWVAENARQDKMYHSTAEKRTADYKRVCGGSEVCDKGPLPLGENLFMLGGARPGEEQASCLILSNTCVFVLAMFEEIIHSPGPSQAMAGWYTKEEARYDYNAGGFSMKTGHFTQVHGEF